MKKTKQTKKSKPIILLLLISSIYIFTLYLFIKYNSSITNQLLIINQLVLASIILTISVICFFLTRNFQNLLKLFFFLVGISFLARFAITIIPLLATTKFLAYLHLFYLLCDTLSLVTISITIIRSNTKRLTLFLPFTPMLLLLASAMIFIAINHHEIYQSKTMPTFFLIKAYYALTLFLLLMFCIPLAKKTSLKITLNGFLFLLISVSNRKKEQFLNPNQVFQVVVNWPMIIGMLLIIYGSCSLLKEKCQQSTLFYPANSAKSQILYWSNSILALLFLILGINTIATREFFHFSHLIFDTNIYSLIPLLGLLSLPNLWYSNLLTNDLDLIASKTKSSNNLSHTGNLYFNELQEFSNTLSHKMNTTINNTAKISALSLTIKQAAHDIKTPLSILSILSENVKNNLTKKSWGLYNSSIVEANSGANQLLTLQKRIANKTVSKENFCKLHYITLLICDFIDEISSQYHHIPIQFTKEISTQAWFTLVRIPKHTLKLILSRFVNDVIKATQKKTGSHICFKLEKIENDKSITLCCQTSQLLAKNDCESRTSYAKDLFINYDITITEDFTKNDSYQFKLTFPASLPTPNWWIDRLPLPKHGLIVIIDDDPLCHQLWKNKLTPYLKLHYDVLTIHCSTENELTALLSRNEKALFLVDYQLTGFSKTGLEYIITHQLENNSILVTNDYENEYVTSECKSYEIQLFPKPLLSLLPLSFFS